MRKKAKQKVTRIKMAVDGIIPHLKPSTFVYVGILLLAGAILVFHAQAVNPKKQTPETEKNIMKDIPVDVKKVLNRQLRAASPSATFAVPVLVYHYVEYVQDKKDTERQSLNINPNIFEQQIQTLLTAGYTFITAKELGDILDGRLFMPEKPVILTFDDGHWDLDTVVLPILKKYGIHATAYIVPGFIGTNSDSLTPTEMQDIVDSGFIDVGAHTVHHIALKGLLLTKLQYEVNESKAMLEQNYHIKVYSFAYPYGSFDQQAINIVRQAGFTTAASTIGGAKQSQLNRFFLYRIHPGYNTGQALLNYIQYWESVPNKTLGAFKQGIPAVDGTAIHR